MNIKIKLFVQVVMHVLINISSQNLSPDTPYKPFRVENKTYLLSDQIIL